MSKLYLLLIALLLSVGVYGQTAKVQVIHNSPTPGTTTGPIVDIYVNDALLPELTAVPFRAATPFLDVAAGVDIEIAVAVSPSNSSADAIATFDVGQLDEDGVYVITAAGIVGDTDAPFDLFVNAMGRTASGSPGQVAFTTFHGSPDAPNVDVDAFAVGNLISDLAFGDYTDYLAVAPANYFLNVRAAGDPNVVATFQADLSALADAAAVVFASGLLGDTPNFGLFAALPDGTVVEFPAAQTTRVQIIHNSPSPTVDIYTNGFLLLDDFEFRTATPFVDVPADVEIDLAVAPETSTSAADAIATFDNVIFNSGQSYVVTANGIVGDPDFPFTLDINDMALEAAVIPGSVAVAALHGSPGAPNVDIDAFAAGNIISDLAYGEYTDDYLPIIPGTYYLDVRAAGDPNVVATFEANLNGLADGAATVFASGLLGGDPGFGLFAALPDGTVVEFPAVETTRMQVIHNSPSGTVDVYANGFILLDDFEFRTATPFINVPADVEVDIAVAPSNSVSVADAIATFDNIVFNSGQTYVVTADGIVGDADFPFTLHVNDMAREAAATAGNVEFSVLHGSPGAPNVDVDAFAVGNLISDLAYGNYTDDYLSVAPRNYFLNVRAAGDPNIVATFQADLSGLADGAATVFASGLLGDDPAFGLFAALPDGTVVEFPAAQTTRVQIIHNSPSPTVDIYTNGLLLVDDFAFRTATPFVNVPADVEIDVAVAPETSTSAADAIATFDNIVFNSGQTYVVVANGIVGDADFPFGLAVNAMARETGMMMDQVDFNVFHGSPGAPNVDVDERLLGNLITDLAYGAFTDDYLSVPEGVYTLDVRATGDPNIVASFEADLNGLAGGAATVFASGLLGDEPAFGLFAALADGTVVEFPVVENARVQVVHNAANPTVDVYANGVLLIDNFTYRDATAFDYLPAGELIDLAIAPENSTSAADAIAVFPGIILDNGESYYVVATGLVGDTETPFDLAIYPGAREAAASGSGVDLQLYHGSTDAPEVDVVVRDGDILFDNVAYGEFADDYVNVPAASYDLDITPAEDNNTAAAAARADVSTLDGGAALVLASGFLSGEMPGFAIFVALPNGETLVLDELTSTGEVARIVNQLDIMPNPVIAGTTSRVEYALTEALNVNVVISDFQGKTISAENLGQLPAGEFTYQLDATNLPQGIYNFSFVTPEGTITKRFVVTK